MNASENISAPQAADTTAEQKSAEISERLESVGVANVLGSIPGFFLSFLWGCVWIVVGSGIQDDRQTPVWAWALGLLPAILIAAVGVFGVIYSIINIKREKAVLCLILSIAGLLLYAAMWGWLYYLLENF